MKKIALFLLLISYFSSNSQTKFSEKKAGHSFFVNIPDYMVRTNALNDVATIQYQNSLKSAYFIVITDSKEDLELSEIKFESLKEFHDTTIKNLKDEQNSPNETEPKAFEQNGMKFLQSELNLTIKEEKETTKITYLITYIESKNHFYQVLCWSLTENFKDLVADFKKIASSIRE